MDLFSLVARLTLDSSEYESGLDEAEQKGSSFGSKIGTAAKGVAAGVTAITGATAAVGAAFIKSAGDVASYGDNIDKASQKVGISAEAYQEWDAILQHSGSSASALMPAMKTLQKQAQKNSDAFRSLGISEQDVANMSKEELFNATITGLQNVQNESERSALATELLGRGAMEMGALLNTSAEDTEAMRKKVHELGGVMSDDAVKAAAAYQDSLQDMQTAMDGVKRGLVSNFLPSITTVMDGIGTLFSGDSDKGLGQIKEGISKFIGNLTEAVPKVIETGTKIVASLGSAIVENLPAIFSAGVQAILELEKGISSSLPQLIPQAVDAVLTLVEGLVDNIDELVEAGVDLMIGLAEGLINAIPKIIEKIPTIIAKIVEALIKSAPKIATAGVNLFSSLVKNLPTIIANIVKAIPSIITSIVKAVLTGAPQLLSAGVKLISSVGSGIVKGVGSVIASVGNVVKQIVQKIIDVFKVDWSQLGKNIVEGVKNGVLNFASGAVNAVKNTASNMWNGFKSFFGISSPSKLMTKGGENVIKGLEKGIKNRTNVVSELAGIVNDKVKKSFDVEGLIEDTGTVTYSSSTTSTGKSSSSKNKSSDTKSSKQGANLTVILELDHKQCAKAVYKLNKEETQRIGVNLAGGYA